jgi:hypothetical protein
MLSKLVFLYFGTSKGPALWSTGSRPNMKIPLATNVRMGLVHAIVQTRTKTCPKTLTMLGMMPCSNTGNFTLHAHNAIIGRSGSLL